MSFFGLGYGLSWDYYSFMRILVCVRGDGGSGIK